MRRVLAVGAHPDDIELGCAGTLAAHRAAGDLVTMLVLTGGQNGPGRTSERFAEQQRASALLGAELLWTGLNDCSLVADSSLVGVIESAIVSWEADVVYVHAPDDSHQDHRATVAATLSAARQRSRVLHYRSPSTAHFHPTIFVDIEPHVSTKLAALRCHRSQVEGSNMVDPEVVEASARYFGALARIRHAEAFVASRFVWDLSPAGTGSAVVGTGSAVVGSGQRSAGTGAGPTDAPARSTDDARHRDDVRPLEPWPSDGGWPAEPLPGRPAPPAPRRAGVW